MILDGARVLAATLGHLGRNEEAHAAVAKLRELDPVLRVSTLHNASGPYRPEGLKRYQEGTSQSRSARMTTRSACADVADADGRRPRLLRELATEGSTSGGQSVSDGFEAGGEHRVPKNRVHRLSLTQHLA